MKEQDTQNQVRQYLTLRRALAIRVNSGSRGKIRFNSEKGCADIICCYKGKFLAIEMKKPGGKLSSDQAEFQLRVEAAGGVFITAESVEDVEKALRFM